MKKNWFTTFSHPQNLAAFFDHELNPQTQQQVVKHLTTCQTCQQEEQQLHHLQQILHSSPEPIFPTKEFFLGQLLEQIPLRKIPPATTSSWTWEWFAPLIVLSGLVFNELLDWAGKILFFGQQTQLFQGGENWFSFAPGNTLWYSVLSPLLENQSSAFLAPTLSLFNQLGVWEQTIQQGLLIQVLGGLCYGAALLLVLKKNKVLSGSRLMQPGMATKIFF